MFVGGDFDGSFSEYARDWPTISRGNLSNETRSWPCVGYSIVLPLESMNRAVSSTFLCGNESVKIVPSQATACIRSFLEDSNNCLLQSDGLRLECVLRNHWSHISLMFEGRTTKSMQLTITLCISRTQPLKVVLIRPLNHRLRPTGGFCKVQIILPVFATSAPASASLSGPLSRP